MKRMNCTKNEGLLSFFFSADMNRHERQCEKESFDPSREQQKTKINGNQGITRENVLL
jgi:hypothetical protein